jgi:hypothetical protein
MRFAVLASDYDLAIAPENNVDKGRLASGASGLPVVSARSSPAAPVCHF